jgi:hypothetical protein
MVGITFPVSTPGSRIRVLEETHICAVGSPPGIPAPSFPALSAFPACLPGWAAVVVPSPLRRRQKVDRAAGRLPGASLGTVDRLISLEVDKVQAT